MTPSKTRPSMSGAMPPAWPPSETTKWKRSNSRSNASRQMGLGISPRSERSSGWGSNRPPLRNGIEPKAPAREAAVHFLGQEAVAACEPALGLDEVEEEDPGELEQRQAPPLLAAERRRKLFGHSVQGGLELTKEAAADGFAAQCIGGAGGIGQCAAGPRAREPTQAGERRGGGPVKVDQE